MKTKASTRKSVIHQQLLLSCMPASLLGTWYALANLKTQLTKNCHCDEFIITHGFKSLTPAWSLDMHWLSIECNIRVRLPLFIWITDRTYIITLISILQFNIFLDVTLIIGDSDLHILFYSSSYDKTVIIIKM